MHGTAACPNREWGYAKEAGNLRQHPPDGEPLAPYHDVHLFGFGERLAEAGDSEHEAGRDVCEEVAYYASAREEVKLSGARCHFLERAIRKQDHELGEGSALIATLS